MALFNTTKRLKLTAMERLDLADYQAEQSGVIDRISNLLQAINYTLVGSGSGQKGLVLYGFQPVANGSGGFKIVGEGAAIDADGKLIIKPSTPDYAETGIADGTHYVFAYYTETDTDLATRRFWNPAGNGGLGAETTASVYTRTQSTYGIYRAGTVMDTKPTTGEKLILIGSFTLTGGVFALTTSNLRVEKRMVGWQPCHVSDVKGGMTVLGHNLKTLSITRHGTNSASDTISGTLHDTSKAGFALVMDDAYLVGGVVTPQLRSLYFAAGAGSITPTNAFKMGGDQVDAAFGSVTVTNLTNIAGGSFTTSGATTTLKGSNAGAGYGVEGVSNSGAGVRGSSSSGAGVSGLGGTNQPGVTGQGTDGGPGVSGTGGNNGYGVSGVSTSSQAGVHGQSSSSGPGVVGTSSTGVGGQFHANATRGSINLVGQNSDPSSPSDGDIWHNLTTDTIKARVVGVTKELSSRLHSVVDGDFSTGWSNGISYGTTLMRVGNIGILYLGADADNVGGTAAFNSIFQLPTGFTNTVSKGGFIGNVYMGVGLQHRIAKFAISVGGLVYMSHVYDPATDSFNVTPPAMELGTVVSAVLVFPIANG